MNPFIPRFAILIFLTAIFSVIVLQFANYNKIALGVSIAGLNLGGQTAKAAESRLAQHFRELEARTITLEYNGRQYNTKLNELGVKLNLENSLRSALIVGRNKNILAGLGEQIAAVFQQYKLKTDYNLDDNAFNNFIARNLNEVEKPPRNANLLFNQEKDDFDITPPTDGWLIDREKFKKDLSNIGYQPKILLTVNEAEPNIKENKAIELRETAKQIIASAPYILKYEDREWRIEKDDIAHWINIEVTPSPLFIRERVACPPECEAFGAGVRDQKEVILNFDSEKLNILLAKIAENINKDPQNASLIIDKNGQARTFSLPASGFKLDINKNIDIIEKAIITNRAREIILQPDEIQPAITNNSDIEKLGLTRLIGRGESNFAGSPKNRIHNIKVGTAKMNGIILRSGEEFSFNKFLGEVNAANGYLPELVIKNRKTVPEYGGGLCQVSTTVFRAAVNTGLQITERSAHPYVVKYYGAPGFDSTIYLPRPDLKFINDTPNNILIQGRAEGTKLIFEIYGTPDNREVKVKGPTVYQSNPDGSMKAILYQEIWRDGQMEKQNIFRSNYKSPALYPIERNPLE